MNQLPSTFGATLAINAKLLAACGFAWLGWTAWPTTALWWGLGVGSIFCGMAALVLIVDAIKIMARVYTREKQVRAYMALGHAPKSSEMASPGDLDKAGMR